MLGWLIFAACFVMSLPAGRYVGRRTVESCYGEPDGVDLVAACTFGVFAMLIFPLVYAWMLVEGRVGGDVARMSAALFGESRERRMVRREAAVHEREKRIARMEQDLGVAPPAPQRAPAHLSRSDRW